MNTHLLLASAFRTLIMGVTLFAALRILRIHQVRAQRTAWLLSLASALAMPVLVSSGVGLHILPSLERHAAAQQPIVSTSVANLRRENLPTFSSSRVSPTQIIAQVAPSPSPARHWPISSATTLYCLVAGFLLGRLAIGLTLALRLRSRAHRVDLAFGPGADVRISTRLATPVTIASSILLPASSAHWPEAKLRVVLSHECAHIRQHDFYIQLLASLHCAIFWFNPFSWWLQKHLSALGEAMSDLAALDHAESRASYAEVLLEFATGTQWPLTGVAMARRSSLRVRIERLLNERLFEQSYTGRRRLPILSATLGVVAVCASTSLVRVHAAQTAASLAPAAVVAAPTPTAAEDADSDGGTAAAVPGTMTAAAEHPTEPRETSQDVPSAPPAPAPEPATPPPPSPGSHINHTYAYNNNGDSYALVTGGGSYTFSGDWNQMGSFEAIRKNIHGDFIYYRHDGKSYVIDDPATVARAKALYAPMEALGKQQEALGKEQEALGRQQEALGKRQEGVKIVNPDLSKERAALAEAEKQLQEAQSQKELDRNSLASLQQKLGEVQGKLGALQGEAGAQQGKLGAEQGKLGEQQGKLGAEQGALGAQQGKLGEEAQRQIVPMIQKAIQDGKAKPVDQ